MNSKLVAIIGVGILVADCSLLAAMSTEIRTLNPICCRSRKGQIACYKLIDPGALEQMLNCCQAKTGFTVGLLLSVLREYC